MVVATGSARYTVISRGRRLGSAAGDAALADGYAPVLTRLRRAARRVVVLRDPPRPPLDIPDCVSESMDDLRRCAFPRAASPRGAPGSRAPRPRTSGASASSIRPTGSAWRTCARR